MFEVDIRMLRGKVVPAYARHGPKSENSPLPGMCWCFRMKQCKRNSVQISLLLHCSPLLAAKD